MKTRGLNNADMLKELTKLENGLKHLQHKLNYKNNNMAPNHTPVPFSTAKTDLVSQRRNMHCILEEISRRQGSSSTSAIKEKRISVRKSQCKCLFHFILWCKKKKKNPAAGWPRTIPCFRTFVRTDGGSFQSAAHKSDPGSVNPTRRRTWVHFPCLQKLARSHRQRQPCGATS